MDKLRPWGQILLSKTGNSLSSIFGVFMVLRAFVGIQITDLQNIYT
jgi:hypothetical protein